MKRLFRSLLVPVFMFGTYYAGNAQCDPSCIPGPQLVPNWDFSMGNVGFSSDLPFNPTCAAASYDVTTDSRLKCNSGSWAHVFDHTSGNGNFMVVDGASVVDQDIWFVQVPVTPGNTYQFSYWIYPTVDSSTYIGYNNRPIMDLRVNGNVINTFNANGVPVTWTEVCASYTAPAGVFMATLELRQTNMGYGGWDYGLDDISFVECTSPDPCDFKFDVKLEQKDCKLNASLFTNIAPPIELVSAQWTFGDGYSATGTSVEHFYQVPGVYQVCVEMVTYNPETRECCVTEKCYEIRVEKECRECNFEEVKFDYTLNEECCEYNFQPIGNGSTEIIGYLWDFGDGTGATGSNPEHIYTAPGVYKVCLTVIGRTPGEKAGCCTYTICREIEVRCEGKPEEQGEAGRTASKGAMTSEAQSLGANSFSIHPNPAKGSFTVEFQQEVKGPVSLCILDMNGRVVQTLMDGETMASGNQQRQFSGLELAPGIYIIHFNQNGNDEVQKLVIQ